MAGVKQRKTASKKTKEAGNPVKPRAAAKAAAKPAAKSAAPMAGPQPGDKAPAFKLRDDAGRLVSLSDFKGKKVVLYFYPKDMTPGCTIQACDFRDGSPKLSKKGAVVLGVSADSVESHVKFKAKHGLDFPLLSDPDRKALEAFGVWQEKSLYGRRFMGIVRTTFIIDENGRIAKAFAKVKVAGHFDEVLASL